MTIETTNELAGLLKQAADAHHIYEQTLGHSDADWPTWYAEWIFANAPCADSKPLSQEAAEVASTRADVMAGAYQGGER